MSQNMRAVVFDGKLSLARDHDRPGPAPGEALVRVALAGICNTDLEIVRGYMGYKGVIGHEFVGVVESVNGPAHELEGRRVVGEINLPCGTCAYCSAGLRSHCPSRKVLGIMDKDGSMAEYLTLPLNLLHPVPDAVSDDEAVFAEPLAAAFEILEQVEFVEGERVLVMGDGKLGLLCALVIAAYTHADVTLLGHHEDKMAIAGAAGVKTHLASKGRPEAPYDMVVEATGNAVGFQQALSLVRARGVVILKSTVAQGAKLNLASVVINELTIIGSRCGHFETAMEALEQKRIDVKALISGTFKLADAEAAFAKAQEKGVLKVLVDMG